MVLHDERQKKWEKSTVYCLYPEEWKDTHLFRLRGIPFYSAQMWEMTEFYFGNLPDHLFALPVLRANKTEVLLRFPEGSRNAGAVAESERNRAAAGGHTRIGLSSHWSTVGLF